MTSLLNHIRYLLGLPRKRTWKDEQLVLEIERKLVNGSFGTLPAQTIHAGTIPNPFNKI